MTFTEAISSVFRDNDRTTRAIWHSRLIYLLVEDGKLCIKGYSSDSPDDGLPHPFIITEQDYFADDWEVVTDA